MSLEKNHSFYSAKAWAMFPDDRRVFADLSVDDNLDIVHQRGTTWNKGESMNYSCSCRNKNKESRSFKWW